ncbi:TPA: RNA-binding protein [Streptococcus suis]
MMVRQKDLLQHIPKEEHSFAEMILDMCQQVEETYTFRLTRFLNPKQEEIVRMLGARFHLQVFSSQEFLATEFSRCILAPEYYQLDSEDFEIQLLEIQYPQKFYSLTHSQVLGTLLNRLGMKRDFLGDIICNDDSCLILIDNKFSLLAQQEIQRIGKIPIKWKERELSKWCGEIPVSHPTKQILVSSLRLDKVVAVSFSLSRSQAVNLIESGHVKVDYSPSQQVSKALTIGQLVSVRGFGRVRLKEKVGYSRQGKLKIEIEIIRK